MRYYRCKCGNRYSWSSMGVPACATCSKCGSDLAEAPSLHDEPKPHDFSSTSTVETDEGPKPLTLCRYCHRTKAEIDAKGL